MKLSGFSILSPREQQMFAQWNHTAIEWERICVPTLFERQAEASPHAPACHDENGRLSYAELNRRANRLAHYLQSQGIAPEERVALFIERSVDFVVGLIGVFKAGGCVVPLDPQYPSAYLKRIIADASPRLVVTSSALAPRLEGGPMLCIDDPMLAQQPESNPMSGLRPENLSHVMYTSGSTGQPKGVMVPHWQIVNWLHALWGRMPFLPDEVVAQKTSVAFAVSVKELLAGLLAGVPQVLLADDVVRDAGAFIEALERWKATRLNIVPSHLQSLLSHLDGNEQALRSLRYCVTAGEPLTEALRAEARAKLPWVTLWNNYGCTELNDVTYGEGEKESTGVFVPIGRPIANTKIYVLDGALRRAPVGVMGELCVESIGMARGYWGKPGLTAERFIPNPFSDRPGARLYRTGDMVRYLADGTLEYLGRHDFEIKIRGHRIDVRQVERALKEHPATEQAVVAAWPRNSVKAQLVAYVVTTAGETMSTDVLRRYLSDCLPAYMVPSLYVALDAMPRLPNGKLNRMGLPEPDASLIRTSDYIAPETEAEKILCGIWQNLLGIERVGVTDNFFSIGGDSISSAKVVAQARKAGIALSTRQLFEHQTIRDLAARVEPALHGAVEGIQRLAPAHYAFLSDEADESRTAGPLMLLRVPADVTEEALKEMLRALQARHDVLRLQWAFRDGEWHASYRNPDAMRTEDALVVEDLSDRCEEERLSRLAWCCDRVAAELSAIDGPMMKWACFKMAEDDTRLLVAMHRLAGDAASLAILESDIEQAWRQVGSGLSVRLAPKTSSYQEWCERFHAHACGAELLAEKGYWLEQLAPSPSIAARAVRQEGTNEAIADAVDIRLSANYAAALLDECGAVRAAGAEDLLLAAAWMAICRWSGLPRLRVAMESDGRSLAKDGKNFSETAGCFTVTYPLALECPRSGLVADVVQAIKARRDAVPHGGVGFAALNDVARDEEIRAADAACERDLAFRYLGVRGEPFATGMVLRRDDRRFAFHARALLSLDACIDDSGLTLSLRDNASRFARGDVALLGEMLHASVREVIEYCHAQALRDHLPEDFSLSSPEHAAYRYHPLPANRHWYFNGRTADLHAWGSAIAFSFNEPGDHAETMLAATDSLLRIHPGLRLQLVCENGRWFERTAEPGSLAVFHAEDLSSLPEPQKEFEFDKKFSHFKESIDLSKALFKLAYFRMGRERCDRIMMVTHHIAIDQYGFDILMSDFQEIFSALRDGRPAAARKADTSLAQWTWAQKRWADSEAAHAVRDFWMNRDFSAFAPLPLDLKHAPQDNSIGSSFEVVRSLSIEETQGFLAFSKKNASLSMLHILLAAVVEGFASWTGRRALCVELVDSGRDASEEGVDVTSTVGWLNEFVPVFIDLDPAEKGLATLRKAAHAIEECTRYGKKFNALKYHANDPLVKKALTAIMEPQVAINFIPPALDQRAGRASRETEFSFLRWEAMNGSRRERVHLLGCEIAFDEGRMRFSWNVSGNVYRPSTVETLADSCVAELKDMIASGIEKEAAHSEA